MKSFYNRALALAPAEVGALLAAMDDDADPTPIAAYLDGEASRRPDVGWDLIAGVAVIYVAGMLVQQTGYLRPCGWGEWACTGYDGIRENIVTAIADEQVRAVALVIDSQGGEVAGCFDLVDMIFAARGTKPLVAICAENACSAAYAIASACDDITLPRTGYVGSVGVVCLHVDMSGMLEKIGIKPTLIQFGARKTDGSPVKPLADPALARFQADVDRLGVLFVETVARNRGISAAKILATEAATFLGELAVAEGLADAVAAPDATMRALIQTLD